MRRLIFGTVLMVVLVSPAARAYDLATESTQVLNNVALLIENIRQLQSVFNEMEMIKNQVEGLKSVATYQNNLGGIDALRNQLTDVTNQGTALSNQTQNLLATMQEELNNMPDSGTMTDQQEAAEQQLMTIVQNSLNRAKQVRQSYQQETSSVNALMDKNNQSVGQTQALQTGNELAAQNIAQGQSARELQSEQISMQAAWISKQVQEEKDENEKMKQIFNVTDNASITASESLK